MRKKIVTLLVIASAFTLGACESESAVDEMLQEDIKLNHTADPGDECKDLSNCPPG